MKEIKKIYGSLLEELLQKAERKKEIAYKEAVQDCIQLINEKINAYEKQATYDYQAAIEQFIADKRLTGCSPGTLKNYGLELQIFKKAINKPIQDVTDIDIKGYLSRFEHLKRATIATKTSILKSFFAYLIDEEIIQKNPMRKIKRIKDEKKQIRYLTMDEMLRIREAAGDDLRSRCMLEFLFETGCRVSEMVQVRLDQVDWLNRSVIVRGKGAKERTVYFHVNAHYYLKKYLNTRLDNSPYLFAPRKGKARVLSTRIVQSEIKKIGEKAGLNKRLHPHMLRHTLATHLLNKGMEISSVAEILGHEKLSTTQIYARITERRKKEEYSRYIA
ncbi:site-specific tyrosine recombinase/integron integrase [Aneurinibacillus aneurinilyticus]|jgi:integrase/recombinase XerD|uniref:site-specific tyrosine recombinase/integron integrase n=1 Tax=Aneurinibacillus aneurinilyticus TaxID=1391 RepID=UPI0023F10ABE|nr:site-specific tyrosine recombinase/integron integrase [Aneurinibacillus aneurinilyticus]